MQEYDLIIAPTLFFFCSAIGIVVYFADRKSQENKATLLLSLSAGFWILCALLADIAGPNHYSLSLFFNRAVLTFVIVLVSSFLYLSNVTQKGFSKSNLLRSILTALAVCFSILIIFTPRVITSERFMPWGSDLVYGPLYVLFAIYATLLMVMACIRLIYNYFKTSKSERPKIAMFLLGLIAFMLLTTFIHVVVRNIVGSDRYFRFGNYGVIVFVLFTAYAIIRQHIFNTRIAVTHVVVVLISSILFSEIFLSKSILSFILRTFVWILVLYGGYLIIKKEKSDFLAQQKLKEMNDSLKRLDQAKDDFINIASHQLKSPIAILKNSLLFNTDSNQKPKTENSESLKQISRLETLVSEILLASKLTTEKYAAKNMEEIDLAKLLLEIVDEQKAVMKENAEIALQIPNNKIPKFFGDTLYLREALMNVIHNAVKYSKPDARNSIVVSLEFYEPKNTFYISCKDTGIGISKEDLPKLFTKFSRGSNVYSKSGTGLGLYITKEIIEGHGGSIAVESELGSGTEICINLPAK